MPPADTVRNIKKDTLDYKPLANRAESRFPCKRIGTDRLYIQRFIAIHYNIASVLITIVVLSRVITNESVTVLTGCLWSTSVPLNNSIGERTYLAYFRNSELQSSSEPLL